MSSLARPLAAGLLLLGLVHIPTTASTAVLRRSSLVWTCDPQLSGVNIDFIKNHRDDFTAVSWWGTAFIRNDTSSGPRFVYNNTYAAGEAAVKRDAPGIDLFPVLEADPMLMAAAAADAATAAVAHGWSGYNIDYEPGGMWQRAEFAQFLANLQPLALALHAAGLELSVDICCIAQVSDFAEQIAGSAVDRWVPMDTYNDDLPSFMDDLDIYQRYVRMNSPLHAPALTHWCNATPPQRCLLIIIPTLTYKV